MPPAKKPHGQLGRPIAWPEQFEESRVWTQGHYIFRLDEKRGIVKRSPLTHSASGGTFFYRFIAEKGEPQATPVLPAKPKPKTKILAPKIKSRAKVGERRSWLRWGLIGLMVLAVVIFVAPWLPEFKYRISKVVSPPPTTPEQVSSAVADHPINGNRLFIPKIGVDTPILEGSSLDVLNHQEGVWHQTGLLALNFVLAGHRFKYMPPNTSTLYNLGKLAAGDDIVVDYGGHRIVYSVSEVKTVPDTEVAVLNSDGQQKLTLYTCNDVRQTQRIVVIAEPPQAP